MATKRDENSRRYKLKTERARIQIDRINSEFLLTAPAAELWQLSRDQAAARIDKLPAQLLAAVRDHRGSPGEIQANLQRVVYACLSEIASGQDAGKALNNTRRRSGADYAV